MNKPIIAITMGDAAGIGPEITCKSLLYPDIYELCRPVVVGDAKVLENIIRLYGLDLKINRIDDVEKGEYRLGVIDVLHSDDIDMDKLHFGELSAMCGDAAVKYTKLACQMAMDKKVGAMVSAPLNKAAMRMAGYHYEGQTQIVGEMTGSQNYGMLQLLGNIRTLMYTTHMSLEDACKKVTYEGILKKIHLAQEGMKFFPIENPLIAVSALNPHCGEGGLFGRQEIDEIEPAIKQAQSEGINVIGPIPADTIYVKAKDGAYDLVISLYHDQSNMAIKLLGFGNVVTLLAGVPVIRTSTGHGTAFDIAGKNIASENNLHEAIKTAAELAAHQKN